MDSGDKKKKDALFNQVSLCHNTGRRMARLKNFSSALYYYDMAMDAEEDATGVDVLVSRSKAYCGLPDHDKARADAELAVQRKPNKPSVLENYASTLYEMDHFEKALVSYHRGLRIRQKPDYFRTGVLIATETVEDSVGRHAGDILDKDNLGDTVLRIWLEEQNLLDPWITRKERKSNQEKKTPNQSEKYFGEKYLSGLTHDKHFILSCEDNTQLYSGNPESYAKLQNVLKEALTKINRRQKTLMRYQPMYIHKMQNMGSMSHDLQKQLLLRKKKEEFAAAKLAFQKVNLAREAQKRGDTVLCLRTTDRAKEFILNQPARLIRDKSVYMTYIYNILGDLYLGMKTLIPSYTQDENDFRILYMIGFKVVNECGEEHLRGSFLPYMHNPQGVLEECERNMLTASSALERAYLFHEMSRCCNQLGRFEFARTMGRRCAQEARPAKSPVWVINGMFMVARFESLQRNYLDAKNTIGEAIEVSKKINENKVTDFLSRTLQLLDFGASLEIEKNPILVKREKDMLASMPSRDMKMEMTMIFMNMSRLPPSRRLMLVPGIVPTAPVKKRKPRDKFKRRSIVTQRGSVRDRRRSQAHEKDAVNLSNNPKKPLFGKG